VADHPVTTIADTALAQRYEQLRQSMLDGHAEGWRHGLGVLTGHGMAAWMRVWTSRPAPPPTSGSGPSPARPAAHPRAGEVIAVLAQMALAHP